VYSPGQTIKFGILLWCTNVAALEALSRPESFQVQFMKASLFGLDVLEPHNSARKNRKMKQVGEIGRIWRTEDAPEASANDLGPKDAQDGHSRSPISHATGTGKLSGRSRMTELYSEADLELPDPSESLASEGINQPAVSGGSAPTLVAAISPEPSIGTSPDSEARRSPSPTPSFENDGFMEDDEPSRTIRLDGEVGIPADIRPPSYRWIYQGLEVSRTHYLP
jgi:hypothetical protein